MSWATTVQLPTRYRFSLQSDIDMEAATGYLAARFECDVICISRNQHRYAGGLDEERAIDHAEGPRLAAAMIEIVDTPVALEVRDRLRPGMRVVFGLLALFPLLAPYDLILRPEWESYLNFPFLFALIISAGALVVSGLLVMAAVAGLNTVMVFDRISGRFTFSRSAPGVPLRTFRYPFAEVDVVEIESHDWSEGAPTFSLRTVMKDGRAFSTGSSPERSQIEDALRRAESILRSQ